MPFFKIQLFTYIFLHLVILFFLSKSIEFSKLGLFHLQREISPIKLKNFPKVISQIPEVSSFHLIPNLSTFGSERVSLHNDRKIGFPVLCAFLAALINTCNGIDPKSLIQFHNGLDSEGMLPAKIAGQNICRNYRRQNLLSNSRMTCSISRS